MLSQYTSPPRFGRRVLGFAAFLGLMLFCFLYGFGYALTTPYLLVGFLAPVVLLALLIVWALPEARSAPTRTITALFFTFTVAHALWPNYLAIALPSLPWITVLRFVSVPMLVLFLIALSTSTEFRREISASFNGSKLLSVAVIAYFVVQLCTMWLSAQFFYSFQRTLVNGLYWIFMFCVAAWVLARPGNMRRWVWALLVGTILLTLIGLAELQVRRPIWAGHIPPFLKVDDPVVQEILAGAVRTYTGIYRVTGTFSHPLLLAEYLILCFPFAAFLLWRSNNWRARALAASAMAAIAVTTVLTDARLGMVGLLVGTSLSVFFWAVKTWRENRRSILAPAAILAFPASAAVLVLSTFYVGRLRAMVWGSSSIEQGSTQARFDQLALGLPKVVQNPFGYGAGRSGIVVGWYSGDKLSLDQGYLSVVVDFGVVGLVLFVAILASAIYSGTRWGLFATSRDRETEFLLPLTISLVVFAVTRLVLAVDYNFPLFFMMLGAVTALAYRVKLEHAEAAGSGLSASFVETPSKPHRRYSQA